MQKTEQIATSTTTLFAKPYVFLMFGVFGVLFFLSLLIVSRRSGIFEMRRMVEWLISVLLIWLVVSLVSLARFRIQVLLVYMISIACLVTCLLLVFGSFSIRQLVIISGFTGGLRYVVCAQKNWLLARRNRTTWQYLQAHMDLLGVIISSVGTIALVSSLGASGLNCTQIESGLRLSGLQKTVQTPTVGELLGIGSLPTTSSQLLDAKSTLFAPMTGSQKGLLQVAMEKALTFSSTLVAQKDLLNHSICELINTQLRALQKNPRRRLIGIVLVYVFVRPLITLFVWVCLPVWRGVYQLLLKMHILQKRQEQTTSTYISF